MSRPSPASSGRRTSKAPPPEPVRCRAVQTARLNVAPSPPPVSGVHGDWDLGRTSSFTRFVGISLASAHRGLKLRQKTRSLKSRAILLQPRHAKRGKVMGLANAKIQLRNPRLPELEAVEIDALAAIRRGHICAFRRTSATGSCVATKFLARVARAAMRRIVETKLRTPESKAPPPEPVRSRAVQTARLNVAPSPPPVSGVHGDWDLGRTSSFTRFVGILASAHRVWSWKRYHAPYCCSHVIGLGEWKIQLRNPRLPELEAWRSTRWRPPARSICAFRRISKFSCNSNPLNPHIASSVAK